MQIIEVKNLGKKYVIGERQRYVALRDTLAYIISSPFKWFLGKTAAILKNNQKNEFWALDDINFSVEKGEVLGIIGSNGAGKSTLLKILSQITPPTTGEIKLNGRVASLLEVGTGFHPELTGRENIYLNGAILGMRKNEIDRKFDEIVAFSGVENFLDTPVKRYSSGMYVRLAFAVASSLEPDILIVDEVLAVGDAEFQKKCLGKMQEVTQKEGRTVLFVSHNMGAIANLCSRSLWIENGKIKMDGQSKDVIRNYLSEKKQSSGSVVWDDIKRSPGDGEFVKFLSVRIKNLQNQISGSLYVEEDFFVELEYRINQPLRDGQLGFKISGQNGEVLFYSGDHNLALQKSFTRESGVYVSRCNIPKNILNQGHYYLSLLGHIPGSKILVDVGNVLEFDVEQKLSISGGVQPGFFRPVFDWQIKKIN